MLNIAYLVFFLVTFPFAMARNRLFGFYYAALYVYSAFALAGYLYLPGISESLQAYFGDQIGQMALIFTFGSMAAFWAVNMVIYRGTPRVRAALLVSHAGKVTLFGNCAFAAITAIFIGLLAINFSSLSWYLFEDSEKLPTETAIFLALYKTTVGLLATGYVILRNHEIRRDKFFQAVYVLLGSAFVLASIRLGNRTDPAAIICGMILYETLARKLRIQTIAAVGAVLLVAFVALSAIEYFRYTEGGIRAPLLERIVRNDYYAPAHMLFAAMAFDFVQPLAVIRSNTANALVMLGEPYLQQIVTELFRTDVATRSAGYAFYIMTEGWIFAGWAGIAYNAIIPSAGLWLWNRLGCTNSQFANMLTQVLVACMLLNVTRGQSSYFIKYSYMFVLPNLVLAAIFVGLRIRLPAPHEHESIPRYAGME